MWPMQCTQANELWMALTHVGSEGHEQWLLHCIQLSCWERGRRCAPASSSRSDEADGKYGIKPLLEQSSDTNYVAKKKKGVCICVVFLRGGYIIKSFGKKERGQCFVSGNTMAKDSLKAVGGNLCGTLFRSRNCRFFFYEKGRRPRLPELARRTRKRRCVHYLLSHNTQEPLCAARETLASWRHFLPWAQPRQNTNTGASDISSSQRAEKQQTDGGNAPPWEMDITSPTVAFMWRLLLVRLQRVLVSSLEKVEWCYGRTQKIPNSDAVN